MPNSKWVRGEAAGKVVEGLDPFFFLFSQFIHLLPESWTMASTGKQFTLIQRVLLQDSSFLVSLNWSESKPVLWILIIQGYSSCPGQWQPQTDVNTETLMPPPPQIFQPNLPEEYRLISNHIAVEGTLKKRKSQGGRKPLCGKGLFLRFQSTYSPVTSSEP